MAGERGCLTTPENVTECVIDTRQEGKNKGRLVRHSWPQSLGQIQKHMYKILKLIANIPGRLLKKT